MAENWNTIVENAGNRFEKLKTKGTTKMNAGESLCAMYAKRVCPPLQM